MFNYYANDGHENCMMMINQNHRLLLHMTKMKMVTLSSSLFLNESVPIRARFDYHVVSPLLKNDLLKIDC